VNKWIRASRQNPCPVCGRGDWCVGNEHGWNCMRVASARPTRNGGWWHPFTDPAQSRPRWRRGVRVVVLADQRPRVEGIPQRAENYQRALLPHLLDGLADELGVTSDSLLRLGAGLALDNGQNRFADAGDVVRLIPATACFSFPMKDAGGDVVGIRLRQAGRKWSVSGGREGLFFSLDLRPGGRLMVTEGPTDCAALLDLGYAAVGRPSCSGGVKLLVDLIRRIKPDELIIVADADEPGQRGAATLASVAALYVPKLRIIQPPPGIKDARAWKNAGATATEIDAAIEAAAVQVVRIGKGGAA